MAPKRKRGNDTETIQEPVRRSARAKVLADTTTTPKKEELPSTGDPKRSNTRAKSKTSVKSTKKVKASKEGIANGVENGDMVADGTSVKAPTKPVEDAKSDHGSQSYWLLKAEPESRMEKGIDVKFSIDDLMACTEPEPWTGVRNHVAKKNMMAMKKGELAFFYHSNCKTPGIAGIMEIVQESSVDRESRDNPQVLYHDIATNTGKNLHSIRNIRTTIQSLTHKSHDGTMFT